MADQFDPYYKWLGISPQNQPPDLYRLLALERFETDPEVIEAAANRQMNYVQGCATGPYIGHSQKLLNEIAAARLCLLDARRKATYDTELNAKLAARATGAPTVGTAVASDDTVRNLAAPAGYSETVIDAGSRRVIPPPPAPARPRPARPGAMGATATMQDQTASRRALAARRKRGLPVAAIVALGMLAVGAIVATIVIMTWDNRKSGKSLSRSGNSAGDNQQSDKGATAPAVSQTSAAAQQPSAADIKKKPGADGVDTFSKFAPPPESEPAAEPEPAAETPASAGDLFQAAEKALAEKNLPAAEAALKQVARDFGNPKHQEAKNLLQQIKAVTSNDFGRRFLRSLDNVKFQAFEQGRLRIEFRDIHANLQSVALETLKRVLPEVQKERMPGEPPKVDPPPDEGEDPTAKPPAEAPDDPAELLVALGMKREFDTWVVTEEVRCKDLVEQFKKAQARIKELARELAPATTKASRAQSQMEQSEKALKKAEAADSPAAGTPEREKLEQRADDTRAAYDDAKAEADRLRDEKTGTEKQAADFLAEARKLATTVDEKYRRHAKDRQIKTAVEQLKQKLGPSEDFTRLREELSRPQPRFKD